MNVRGNETGIPETSAAAEKPSEDHVEEQILESQRRRVQETTGEEENGELSGWQEVEAEWAMRNR